MQESVEDCKKAMHSANRDCFKALTERDEILNALREAVSLLNDLGGDDDLSRSGKEKYKLAVKIVEKYKNI